MSGLRCDMREDCGGVVTHVDESGYVYCLPHGNQRKYDKRCRKLRPAEIRKLLTGGTITYRR